MIEDLTKDSIEEMIKGLRDLLCRQSDTIIVIKIESRKNSMIDVAKATELLNLVDCIFLAIISVSISVSISISLMISIEKYVSVSWKAFSNASF